MIDDNTTVEPRRMRSRSMTVAGVTSPIESPLLAMTRSTPTDYWNDSCASAELEYAVARGATGATSNPSIVLEVLRKEQSRWLPRILQLIDQHPSWSEVDLAWALIEEMAVAGAAVLEPVFRASGGRKGRLSVQTNPANYRSSDRMLEQGVRFSSLAPNIQVKFPATRAGLEAIERATTEGVNVNATVSFTVAQAVAVGEAVERGLDARAARGEDTATMTPVCTIMIGRLDDWMRVLVERDDLAVHPDALDWAGIAVFKRAVDIYRQRGFRTRLLAAAYRHRLHWTELVGGDVILTMPYAWQVRFNSSGIEPVARIDEPVDDAHIDELLARVPDFARAYAPDGLATFEFDTFGPTVRTLRGFIASYHDLVKAVRDVMLPDPDVRRT
jgi:transaldolase